MKLKKMSTIALSLLLASSLVACGAEEGTADPKTKASQSKAGSLGYAKQLSNDLPWLTEDHIELSDDSSSFIKANETLFSSNKKADLNELKKQTDSTISAIHLFKSVTPYLSNIVSVKGTVISIEEISEDGPMVTNVDVTDEEGNTYSYISYKKTKDIFDGDVVEFWGTPLGVYSFDNVSGGLTNSIAIFGGQIEKR
ncbi:hypothetical protein KZO01_19840 [Kurthia zopfii]|uniref:tRNA_anti-like n=1 Tax=Kurthia zopfii TaxID=1650 RepID=A0A8B4Q607_9BACL|nr:hypothetical protein [Kurthia zopfii]PWI22525.1 hypothetical protein DF281_06820 [Kurthia zopfii]TDR38654.1 hypothetical protein DFR61_11529 [Kurthia zopfii]GEK31675.1 hypothetical protein KZO01_19840 [Kurthia zopfii]STX08739.1 Uncharacterised protein [Kurthia zopfii]